MLWEKKRKKKKEVKDPLRKKKTLVAQNQIINIRGPLTSKMNPRMLDLLFVSFVGH